MSIRYYISPVRFDPDEGSYRPASDRHLFVSRGTSQVAAMTDPIQLEAWALVKVDVVGHAPFLADGELDSLPQIPLDTFVNTGAPIIQAALRRRGPSVPIAANDTLRMILGRVARLANPAFRQDDWL